MFDMIFLVVYFWVAYGAISTYNATKKRRKRKKTGKSSTAVLKKGNKHKQPDKYIYPIIRIVISIILMVLFGFVHFLLHSENQIIDGLLAISVLVLFLLGFASIFIAISQMFDISDSREKQKLKKKSITQEDCVEKSKSEIKRLLRENDIIEFTVLLEGKMSTIGASSVTDSPAGEFYDKRYYVNDEEYDSFNSFCLSLEESFSDEILYVYSMDGVKLKKRAKKKG